MLIFITQEMIFHYKADDYYLILIQKIKISHINTIYTVDEVCFPQTLWQSFLSSLYGKIIYNRLHSSMNDWGQKL